MKKLLSRLKAISTQGAVSKADYLKQIQYPEFDVALVNIVLMRPFIDGFLIEDPFLFNEWERLHKHWLRLLDSFEVVVDKQWKQELRERERICRLLCFLIITAVRNHRDFEPSHALYRKESVKFWNRLQELSQK